MKMPSLSGCLLALPLGLVAIGWQAYSAPLQRLQFEVASVKSIGTNATGVNAACKGIDGTVTVSGFSSDRAGSATVPQGRCIGRGPVSALVSIAYDIRAPRISGARDPREFYQIEAKAEDTGAATTEQLRQMLQSLLADHFKLQVRREIREMDGYALVIGRNGVKFEEASGGEERLLPQFQPRAPGQPQRERTTTIKGNFTLRRVAEYLTQMCCVSPGPSVIDQTGLPGIYAIELTLSRIGIARPLLLYDPPLDRVLEDELGLRLEPRKVPVEYLVIDHVEKPPEN